MAMSPLDTVTDFGQFAGLKAQAREQNPAALLKTARQFESLMLQQMLKAMRAATPGEDALGGGEQTNFYRDMFDQQLAVTLSSGKGVGLADMMVRQLKMSQSLGGGETGVSLDTKLPARSGLSALIAQRPEVVQAPETTEPVQELKPPVALKSDETLTEFRPRTPQEFIDAVLPHAEKAAKELGIPARVLVAQAALETGWGKHQIRHADGKASFNLFGIKADKSWDGDKVRTMTHEYEGGRMQRQDAKFRAYGSIAESFDDYARFLKSNPRYEQALRHQGSAHQFATGLQKAGYATDPSYAQKIMRIAYGPTVQTALNKSGTVMA
ncbi:flagellar assembly peptidoglycan hydrolase FlgJ [Solimonas sp. K1W22B-7]|uniref:flagellar assembly peptidoglycan hydrolase FlgJ n=1 Tax=Solimonas sp. K1W22B-7 TaxID=2303331 RepID=UPI000E33414C|nr:flagellar assembly peptidoglycan hydrolase FlgJ [Solimonas sp. K1W22B-7]AXQ30399.1 flagellar assembly peptidoglycan hydrolase FlgJ [Solimonas sp. K1W22B-7]